MTITVPGPAEIVLPESASQEEWLAERRKSVGASEVAALVGASPYATAFDVFVAKADGWNRKEFTGNKATEWGHWLEPVIVERAARELDLGVAPGGQLWRAPKQPYVHCTPDAFGIRSDTGTVATVIEAKTSGYCWDDGPPLHYQAQVQVQLHLLGLEAGYLACMVLSADRIFDLIKVPYDPDWAAELVTAAENFWTNHVQVGLPPVPDYAHPRTAELLKQIHPHVARPRTNLPAEAEEWRAEYHTAKQEAEKATARVDELTNLFRMHLGDAADGYLGNKKVASWPEIRTQRINITKLRENYPKVAKACTVKGTYRRLTVK